MSSSTRVSWHLLKPHVRPFGWALVLIFLLGGFGALGNRSVVIFTDPLLTALFPNAEKEGEASAAAFSDALESMQGTLRALGVSEEHLAAAVEAAESRRPARPVPAEAEPSFLDPLGLNHVREYFDGVREDLYAGLLGELSASPTPDEKFDYVARIVAVFVGLSILTATFMFAFTMLSRWVGLRMIISLRMQVARHLIRQSARYHGSQKFGDLLSRISSDVQTTLAVINDCLKELVEQPFIALVSISLAFAVAPLPTFYLVLTLPLLMLPVALLTKRIRKRSKKSLTVLGSSVQVLSQMFQGIRTVKAFRAEEREIERFEEINRSYLGATMKMVRAIATTHLSTLLISHLGMAVLLIAIGWFTIHGGLFESHKDFTMLLLLVASLYTSIKKTTRVWTRVQESMGAAQRLQELLDTPNDIVDRDGAVALAGLGSGIEFQDVGFAYEPDEHGEKFAVSGLSLRVRPGETLALVGPSGAGKSTVIDLIARFLDPDSGSVRVDGHDLRDVTLDSWTGLYAMVGQHPFLFHATIEENIRYGKPDATRAEVEAAARAANIHDFITSLPDGYATDVAEAGSRLSGGQRQRITIARAILKSAPLLLLDEATSALDTESEKVVQEALEHLMEGHTVVVIAHRLSTIRGADRIAVMDAGRLVEIGTHEELMAKRGLYARLHAAQFAGMEVAAS